MSFAVVLFVVFTTSQLISAAPYCGLDAFVSCLLPLKSYFMDPQGQDLVHNIDQYYGDFCRVGISFGDCYKDFITRCATGSSDAKQFAVKTAQLFRRCDYPRFGSDFRTLAQCTNTLNMNKSRTLACSNAAGRWVDEDLRGLLTSQNGHQLDYLKAWNSGAIFNSLCCATKYFQQCRGSEVSDKCGPQAEQVINNFQEAITSTYNCKTRTNKCPRRPDPSPEDYAAEPDMDFMSLFKDSMDDRTYASVAIRFKTSTSSLVHASYITVVWVLVAKALFGSRWVW